MVVLEANMVKNNVLHDVQCIRVLFLSDIGVSISLIRFRIIVNSVRFDLI